MKAVCPYCTDELPNHSGHCPMAAAERQERIASALERIAKALEHDLWRIPDALERLAPSGDGDP